MVQFGGFSILWNIGWDPLCSQIQLGTWLGKEPTHMSISSGGMAEMLPLTVLSLSG